MVEPIFGRIGNGTSISGPGRLAGSVHPPYSPQQTRWGGPGAGPGSL